MTSFQSMAPRQVDEKITSLTSQEPVLHKWWRLSWLVTWPAPAIFFAKSVNGAQLTLKNQRDFLNGSAAILEKAIGMGFHHPEPARLNNFE